MRDTGVGLKQWGSRHADTLLTVAYAALGMILAALGFSLEWRPAAPDAPVGIDLALIGVLAVIHLFRLRRTTLCLALSVGLVAADAIVFGSTPIGAFILVADLVYLLGRDDDRRVVDVLWYVSAATALAAALLLATSAAPLVAPFAVIPMTLAISLWWGRSVRAPRVEAERERARAEAIERAVDADQARALAEERLAIARELHDVLAGDLAAIALRSEIALRRGGGDDPVVRESLEQVRTAAHDAIGNVRRTIGALRDPGDSAAPGMLLENWRDVVEQARAVGIDITLSESGDTRALRGDIDLALARLVREALTNVRKHAPGARVIMVLDIDENALSLTVTNAIVVEGAASTRDARLTGGLGLVGARERARLLGGTVEAGPIDDEWVFAARLQLTTRLEAAP
ncbi:signal transduction histidine kinase [Agromyces atrinae]|uniref:histidine kinase n=1 Tax=Agromyces atrinae TaxID=592376 RepID=A0A4Q2M4U9_9MICO|nr:histidine kinase [Agromyces atrinae]NYD66434.1 signal transduction histidine kinase [Agromyces atrinae]RXZ87114.1 hypothetical protein ESP50_04090 [Agromyces atrinae]